MNNRTKVMKIASSINQVCCASKITTTKLLASAQTTLSPTSRQWVSKDTPRRGAVNALAIARIVGSDKAVSTKLVNNKTGALGISQITTNDKNAAGEDNERRKLSSIFQRPIIGIP